MPTILGALEDVPMADDYFGGAMTKIKKATKTAAKKATGAAKTSVKTSAMKAAGVKPAAPAKRAAPKAPPPKKGKKPAAPAPAAKPAAPAPAAKPETASTPAVAVASAGSGMTAEVVSASSQAGVTPATDSSPMKKYLMVAVPVLGIAALVFFMKMKKKAR